MTLSRRHALQMALAVPGIPAVAARRPNPGIEGQRTADLGNVFGGFVGLRPALFSAGAGEVRARNFVYRGLPT